MAAVFQAIVDSGRYQPFGGFNQEQVDCRTFTEEHLSLLLEQRQREKFLHEVVVCVGGLAEEDEDEPLEDHCFSQYQFYKPYTEDLISFEDKFDFLILCVSKSVCKVQHGFEERYRCALLQALTFREVTLPPAPVQVLDLIHQNTPRTVGEVRRSEEERSKAVERYVRKEHTFGDELRAELTQLESEQYEVEKGRGEHKSLMGWDEDRSKVEEQEKPIDANEKPNELPSTPPSVGLRQFVSDETPFLTLLLEINNSKASQPRPEET